MAGTGWRTSLVRLVLGAGLLCAAWLLLGAGKARADEAPRGASTPSFTAVQGVTHLDAGLSKRVPASAPAAARAHAVTQAVQARPVGHPERPVVKAGVATLAQRPVVTSGVVTVAARVARPVVHAAVGTVSVLDPVVDRLSQLPVVRRLPVTAVAEKVVGEGLRELPVVSSPVAPATSPDVTTQSSSVARTPAGGATLRQPRVVPGPRGTALAPTGSVPAASPAASVASRSSGGGAPEQPGGQGGAPLPIPTSAGNCSSTTDLSLPAATPVLPLPAHERGFEQPSGSSSASAKGPGNRPD